MNQYDLKCDSQYLHPSMMNAFRTSARVEGYVNEDNKVQFDSFTFTVMKSLNKPLLPGTKVYIWLTRDFICASVEEVKIEQDERLKASIEAEKKNCADLEKREFAKQQKAIATNSKIKLPVEWLVGIKDVLSGLSESSNGSGSKSNTVNHILLPEGISSGRIERKPGDFLCTPKSGSNGKQWSNQPEEQQSLNNKPEVTCKSCLTIAQGISERLDKTTKKIKELAKYGDRNAETKISMNLGVDR
jgi:hypothetical protein